MKTVYTPTNTVCRGINYIHNTCSWLQRDLEAFKMLTSKCVIVNRDCLLLPQEYHEYVHVKVLQVIIPFCLFSAYS